MTEATTTRGLSGEKLPNKPLTGTEFKKRIIAVLEKELLQRMPHGILFLDETVIKLVRDEFDRDHRFNFQTTFPGAEYTIEGKFHFTAPGSKLPRVAWSLEVRFKFTTIHMPNSPVKARTTPPPMALDEDSGVIAFRVTEKIDNPNLVRVHTGLPIEVTVVEKPDVGQMFGKMERHAVQYDPAQYPELPEPVVEDISEETAAEWRIPRWKVPVEGERVTSGEVTVRPEPVAKPKPRYKHLDKDDLDAISEAAPE